MNAPYQAVILAAGSGSRLGEETRQIPKALLPIGPQSLDDHRETTFLERQVEILNGLGVQEIVVVIGALRERVLEAARGWEIPVKLVVNPSDSKQSGSLHSFQFAVRSEYGVLDGRRQTLMMDADIVYHRDVLEALLAAPERTTVLVSPCYTADAEEVLVYGSIERPRFLGKALSPALTGDEPCLGEAAGIVKFAPADHKLARETVDWLVGDPDAPEGTPQGKGFGPAGRSTEHEELTQRFMDHSRIVCVRFSKDLPFMECDNKRDYKRLRESFYPRLLETESIGRRTERCLPG